jgi:hypothetical protein
MFAASGARVLVMNQSNKCNHIHCILTLSVHKRGLSTRGTSESLGSSVKLCRSLLTWSNLSCGDELNLRHNVHVYRSEANAVHISVGRINYATPVITLLCQTAQHYILVTLKGYNAHNGFTITKGEIHKYTRMFCHNPVDSNTTSALSNGEQTHLSVLQGELLQLTLCVSLRHSLHKVQRLCSSETLLVQSR